MEVGQRVPTVGQVAPGRTLRRATDAVDIGYGGQAADAGTITPP
jgi:hypothetical protein